MAFVVGFTDSRFNCMFQWNQSTQLEPLQEEYEMNATAFENPTGNWSYDGPFQAHVTADANVSRLVRHDGVQIDGTIIRVGQDKRFPGRIAKGVGAIQMYAGIDQPFYFGYKYLIRLCRPNGQLIWQNHHLQDVVMQKIKGRPRLGAWPMFYYDGERVIGQIGSSGPWYQLNVGQEVRFSRHGAFRFTKAFKTLVYLDVTLPRKGWNPVKSQYRIRIPTDKYLTVRRNEYSLEWMNWSMLDNGFGYRPGYQPLRETEVNEMLEMLQLGPLMEERARKAMAASVPYEVRRHLRSLKFAAMRSHDLSDKVEKIKSKLLA